jgi:hypothetical protein
MRRILVDHARREQSLKRGAGAVREELHDSVLVLSCWVRGQDGAAGWGLACLWGGIFFILFLAPAGAINSQQAGGSIAFRGF